MEGGETIESLLILALVFTVWMAAFAFLIARAYKKATPQRAFVRSGMGGTKVVINGGVLVFPQLNDLTWVGMSAMPVDVKCCEADALTFSDGNWQGKAQCVVRVVPDEVAVMKAATTWGDKTLAPDRLQPLIEGHLIEALQNAARTQKRAQMHQRTAWNHQVQAAFAASETNGLQLESIRMIEAPCD